MYVCSLLQQACHIQRTACNSTGPHPLDFPSFPLPLLGCPLGLRMASREFQTSPSSWHYGQPLESVLSLRNSAADAVSHSIDPWRIKNHFQCFIASPQCGCRYFFFYIKHIQWVSSLVHERPRVMDVCKVVKEENDWLANKARTSSCTPSPTGQAAAEAWLILPDLSNEGDRETDL